MKNFKVKIEKFPTQLCLTLIWVILAIPTILWWKDSVAWVSLMSIYAIIVSHFAAHIAWKTERKVEETKINQDDVEQSGSSPVS